ncbi:hypothetical protein BJ138DRAFT_16739 [Hygrophoropsis aurantiaca]|uniref:Uncharacterized protein n=1 Tax=Hygrophoropsis aurantiaca TaxID=72124 RepID=A0ACB8ARE1_9AGAM|nr:hypothetical protein BJ138DRAFT_16739 [Hygrophoropsis aurantiaca]
MFAFEAIRGPFSVAVISLISLLHFSGIHTLNMELLIYRAIPRLVEGLNYRYPPRIFRDNLDPPPPPPTPQSISYTPAFVNETAVYRAIYPHFMEIPLVFVPIDVSDYFQAFPSASVTVPLPIPANTEADMSPYIPRKMSFCPVIAFGQYIIMCFRAYITLMVS